MERENKEDSLNVWFYERILECSEFRQSMVDHLQTMFSEQLKKLTDNDIEILYHDHIGG